LFSFASAGFCLRIAFLFFIDFSLMSSDPSASALTNPMLHLLKSDFQAAISCY
jgi:hypothetical protein